MLRSRYIRLFVSSTFEDMLVERDILQRKVFPRISQLCGSYGWQFEDIDLRWGVSQDASRLQKTMQICLNEIKRCQALSPKPNFLILQGDRYGWIPIPEIIPFSEWQGVMKYLRPNELKLFETWYDLDENAVGGEYLLKPRDGEYLDYAKYAADVENPLREIFRKVAEFLPEDRQKYYYASATEQEIMAGLYEVEDAREHVMLYSRHLINVPRSVAHVYDDSPKSLLGVFKKDNRQHTLRNQISSFVGNKIEKELHFDKLQSEEYAKEFEEKIYAMLEDLVLREIHAYSGISEMEAEREKNLEFIKSRTSFLIGRDSFVESLLTKISEGPRRPVVVTGQSGCGKSSVVAKVVSDASTKMDVIARFVGHTFIKSFGEELLRSIWAEMDLYCPTQLEFSVSNFAERLASSKFEKPLLIVIDGMDQLQLGPSADEFLKWMWVPDELSENVTVLCSVVTGTESIWQPRDWFEVFSLKGLSEEDADVFVRKSLALKSRQLTEWQLRDIRKAISVSSRQPIYLSLLADYASRLHSYDIPIPYVMRDSATLFEYFLEELVLSDHGGELVVGVLSHIVLSEYGMSQNELREILPMDQMFWDDLTSSSHYEINPKLVPSVMIVRLLNDLGEFIYHQSAFDKILITFKHKVLHRYVVDWLQRVGVDFQPVYKRMYAYFDQKWRTGDLHAVYEIPMKAKYVQNNKVFLDLDYCIMKIWKGSSDALRPLGNLGLSTSMEGYDKKDLLTFMKFDAEADAYVSDHECQSSYQGVRQAVMGLAANWSKGTVVRDAFENASETYSSMVNTIGSKGYDSRLFKSLPFKLNDSACIDNGGNLCWIEQKQLCSYLSYYSMKWYMRPEYRVDDFRQVGNSLVIRLKDTLIVEDIEDKTLARCNVGHLCSDFLDLNVHVNENKETVIAFHDKKHLCVLYVKGEDDCRLFHHDISAMDSPKIIGFLKDGEWIVTMSDSVQQENGREERYNNVTAYEISTMKNKGGMRHRATSRSAFQPVVSSASGYDILISSSSNFISVCDFSQDKMKFENIQLFNQWGRLGTYALHISKDEKTFWAIGGDMRLILYDLENRCNRYVINMLVEDAMFKASEDNRFLLMSIGEGPRKSFNEGRVYDTVLDISAFGSSEDYFPSLLTTMSADASARQIFTSHGSDPQTNAEGAVMFHVDPDKKEMIRIEYDDMGTMERFFAMSTAVSFDGTRYVYARGALVERVGTDVLNYYEIPQRKEPVEIRYPNRDVWSFISRIEYTPGNSAFLALSGRADIGESSQNGYLFVTGCEERGVLKHVIDLPKDKKFISFTNSYISGNGAYALVWSGNRVVTDYVGLLIDLRKNQLLSRLNSTFDMKFFPDSKAGMMTVITKYVPVNKGLIPYMYEFGVGMIDSIYGKPGSLLLYKWPNTVLGDISPSGRYFVRIDHSVPGESSVYTSYNKSAFTTKDYVNACRIAYDDIHMFIICDTVIYLIHIPTMKIVQKFHMNYPNDNESRSNSRVFISHNIDKRIIEDGKVEYVHNSRHFQLYDKGLLISDWDRIFRLEPDGYEINKVSFATISRVWNHRTDEFEEPTALCPMCGKRFVPDSAALACIENICKDLPVDASPCQTLKYDAWEAAQLQNHACPHCRNKLRFNPFIG